MWTTRMILKRLSGVDVCARAALKCLGISPSLSLASLRFQDLKRAYLRRVLKVHPDCNRAQDEATATEQFQALTEALTVCLGLLGRADTTTTTSDSQSTMMHSDDEHDDYSSIDFGVHSFPSLDVQMQELMRQYEQQAPVSNSSSSLEDVVAVCCDEWRANGSIKAFQQSLAVLLCGHSTFDVFIDGDPEHQAEVLRQIKNFSTKMPNMVARVVRLRGNSRSALDHSARSMYTSGVVEGSVHNSHQVIAEFGLKPLSLMGFLMFTDKKKSARPVLPPHVQCTRELCCVIHSSDTLPQYVDNFIQWEKNSLERLRCESAISFCVQSLSHELHLSPPLTSSPILKYTTGAVKNFAEQLRRTTTSIVCLPSDEDLKKSIRDEMELLRKEFDLCACIAQLRLVYETTGSSADDVCDTTTTGAAAEGDEGKGSIVDGDCGYRICRSADACAAESVQYDVTIRFNGKSVSKFLEGIKGALRDVGGRLRRSFEILPAVVALRNNITQLTPQSSRAITCFPRVFGMETQEELAFWQHVSTNSGWLLSYQPLLTAMNVTLEDDESSVSFGWCKESPDGDHVTISKQHIASADQFEMWMRDVCVQCALSKQATDLLYRNRISYVARDPTLVVAHFLTFVQKYVPSAARGVIEEFAHRCIGGSSSSSTAESAGSLTEGLTIVVSSGVLRICNGALHVPWWCEPSELLKAFLRSSRFTPALHSSSSGEEEKLSLEP